MKITENMTLKEAVGQSVFSCYSQFLLWCKPSSWEHLGLLPLSTLRQPNGYNPVLEGLNHVINLQNRGVKVNWQYWESKDVEKEPDRADTILLFLPGKPNAPFVLLLPGGGYQSVCTCLEGLPAAVKLNDAGYNAFVISYRVGQEALMPKPIDDIKQALRFILNNTSQFQVDKNYALMGFSAGGHLAAECATTNFGVVKDGLPAPSAMLLCYPAIDVRLIGGNSLADRMIKSLTIQNDRLEEYCVNLHLDKNYPPTCIWQCEDDEMLSFSNYERMCQALSDAKVPYTAFSFPTGGHGMANPHPPEQDMWTERMLDFLKNILGEVKNEQI